jgi:hypothetical protein
MDPDLEADVLEFVSALGTRDSITGAYEPSEDAPGEFVPLCGSLSMHDLPCVVEIIKFLVRIVVRDDAVNRPVHRLLAKLQTLSRDLVPLLLSSAATDFEFCFDVSKVSL